jgi:hypothetical protein
MTLQPGDGSTAAFLSLLRSVCIATYGAVKPQTEQNLRATEMWDGPALEVKKFGPCDASRPDCKHREGGYETSIRTLCGY